MKLKLRSKIIWGLVLVFAVSLGLGIYGFTAINRITDYNQRLDRLVEASNQADAMLAAHHVWLFRITSVFYFDADYTLGVDPTICIWGSWRYGDGTIYDAGDPVIWQLIQAVDHPHARLHLDGAEALRLREAGYYEEARYLLENTVVPYGNQSTAAISALAARYMELWEEVREASAQVGPEVLRNIIIIYIGAAILFVTLCIVIPRSILKPIKQLVRLVSDVSVGKLNVNIDKSIIANDEIGMLTNDMQGLTDIIRGIVDDLMKLEHEYNVVGDIDYRIDADKYQNSFKEMVEGVNNIPDNIVRDVLGLLDGLSEINKGNFNPKVVDLPGKKMVLPNTVRATISNLNAVNDEMTAMIDAIASKGDLSIKIDALKYEGGWREIMNGLNDIAKSVDTPLRAIEMGMAEMQAGNFNLQDLNKKIIATGISASAADYEGSFRRIISSMDFAFESTASYIQIISDDLKAIASGDLTTTIVQDFVGDYAAIKDSLNQISTSLNKTMSEINSASEQVLSGAKQISSSAMDLANGASQQASSVEELNVSVDLINSQTQKNAVNANEANALSNTSTSNAREGNEAMQQTLVAMNQIKEASNNISKIIRTIQDIAFQTNLLALNAAVEAARAGEHGKGFAVVAEEVRSLAARSQEAASETTELIGTSISTVESGAEIARSTAETLDTIVENANKVLSVISEISNASQEQAEAISQVVLGLQQVSQIVQSNSAVSEETAAASEELTSQAELLQQLVSYFKI